MSYIRYLVKNAIYVTYTTIFVLNNYSPKKDNFCRQQVDNICLRQYLSSTGWLKAGYGLVMMMMTMGHI